MLLGDWAYSLSIGGNLLFLHSTNHPGGTQHLQAPAVCRIKRPGGGDVRLGWFEPKPGGGTCYMGDVRKAWGIQTPIGFNSLDWAKNGTTYGMQVCLPSACRATAGLPGCRPGRRSSASPAFAVGCSQ